MKYYLYRHIRLDKNEPFYIGIGTKGKNYSSYEGEYRRAFYKKFRNEHWHNIVNNTEYEVEILFESDSLEEIKEKEIEFIALYGRRDLGKGTLCNWTDGGDSGNLSEVTLKKMSTAQKGNTKALGYRFSEEMKLKFSLLKKGKPSSFLGKHLSEEAKKKIGDANRGRKRSLEEKLKQSITSKSRYDTRIIVNSKSVLNLQNGIFYKSMKEAHYYSGFPVSISHFQNMLAGRRPNITDFILLN